MRLQESARLERGLLPQPLMRTGTVRVHAFYRSGRHSSVLGGDFYDVVQTSPDRLHIMIGDVCGHGTEEAALGVELRVAWRALILARVPEAEVLPTIEQVLISERRSDEIFATIATVTVHLRTRRATIRLAGHPPPLLVRAGRAEVIAAQHDPVLGVLPGIERTATEIRLDPADWALLLYTDGLIEGRVDGQTDRLGVAGLCTLLTGPVARQLPLPRLPLWLVNQAESTNRGPLADDVAMLLVAAG